MATQVTIAGASGSLDVEVQDGFTVKDVLVEAAAKLGLENPVATVEHLAPVVDSKPAKLNDAIEPTARRLSAAPAVTNG